MLRTSFPLTEQQQKDWYFKTVNDRNSNARFWAITDLYHPDSETLIGMVGIENISWENRSGELSVILSDWGRFSEALGILLCAGFFSLNLENLYTEVYDCSEISKLWYSAHRKYTDNKATQALPNRKFWNGRYYNSIYLNFNRQEIEHENTISLP
jgi:hypothetical protein